MYCCKRNEEKYEEISVLRLLKNYSDVIMGRRKAKKAAPKRKAVEKLDEQFNCPFCNHEKSCDVKLTHERKTGYISCRVCLEDFQTVINGLSEPIDVYNDWMDACESAN